MPRPKLKRVLETPKFNTICFNLGHSLKDIVDGICKRNIITRTEYVSGVIRRLLLFFKRFESYLLRPHKNRMDITSVSQKVLSQVEHNYIFKLVDTFRIFFSRSELIRFAIFLEIFMNISTIGPKELKLYPYVDKIDNGELIEVSKEEPLSFERLRKIYPNMPEYKFMNEE